jgi:tRNA threonylcarbamoyladenosine biosynthesis protein TsaB
MLILALDSALSGCAAAVVADGAVASQRHSAAPRGQAEILPTLVAEVLAAARVAPAQLDLVAVTVGPGSFTGLRAGLSLAHGLALGAGVPVVGVTVAEALADSLPGLRSPASGRALWVAIDSRRGRVFLDRGEGMAACALDALPMPEGPVAVAGDAAIAVAARLAARNVDVMLTDARRPLPRHVALVAAQRAQGALPPLPAQPLYVDPPEAKLPATPPRPPPV